MKSIKIVILLLGFFFTQLAFGQFTIPEKPKVQTSVYDYVNLLSEKQKINLESELGPAHKHQSFYEGRKHRFQRFPYLL